MSILGEKRPGTPTLSGQGKSKSNSAKRRKAGSGNRRFDIISSPSQSRNAPQGQPRRIPHTQPRRIPQTQLGRTGQRRHWATTPEHQPGRLHERWSTAAMTAAAPGPGRPVDIPAAHPTPRNRTGAGAPVSTSRQRTEATTQAAIPRQRTEATTQAATHRQRTEATAQAATHRQRTEVAPPAPERRAPAPERRAPAPERRAPAPERRAPAPDRRAPAPERRATVPEQRAPASKWRAEVGTTSAPGPSVNTSTAPAAPERRAPAFARRTTAPRRRAGVFIIPAHRRRVAKTTTTRHTSERRADIVNALTLGRRVNTAITPPARENKAPTPARRAEVVIPPTHKARVQDVIPPARKAKAEDVTPPTLKVRAEDVTPPTRNGRVENVTPPAGNIRVGDFIPPARKIRVEDLTPPAPKREANAVALPDANRHRLRIVIPGPDDDGNDPDSMSPLDHETLPSDLPLSDQARWFAELVSDAEKLRECVPGDGFITARIRSVNLLLDWVSQDFDETRVSPGRSAAAAFLGRVVSDYFNVPPNIRQRAAQIMHCYSCDDYSSLPATLCFRSQIKPPDPQAAPDKCGYVVPVVEGVAFDHQLANWARDPQYFGQAAGLVGHNGLTVGEWFPTAVMMSVRGAHDALMSGIRGDSHGGAYSVLVAPPYLSRYEDGGDTLWFVSPAATKSDQDRHVQYLVISMNQRCPIRVLRARGRFGPKMGYRYDGLYTVAQGRWRKSPLDDGSVVAQFRLDRNPGQTPLNVLCETVPSALHMKVYGRMHTYREINAPT